MVQHKNESSLALYSTYKTYIQNVQHTLNSVLIHIHTYTRRRDTEISILAFFLVLQLIVVGFILAKYRSVCFSSIFVFIFLLFIFNLFDEQNKRHSQTDWFDLYYFPIFFLHFESLKIIAKIKRWNFSPAPEKEQQHDLYMCKVVAAWILNVCERRWRWRLRQWRRQRWQQHIYTH